MDRIQIPDEKFDFSKLFLGQPNGMQGGAYFTKMFYNDDPLYIQTPKCLSRQGIVTTGKKSYIDLMYTINDNRFVEWLENLESEAVKLIYEKKNLWFNNELEMDDIQTSFNSPIRPYKGGKNYLVRVNIMPSKITNVQTCSVFDENEQQVSLDYIKSEHMMIPIIEFLGIKFTSRSFQIEIALKQVLIIPNKPLFQSCMIRKNVINMEDRKESKETLGKEEEENTYNRERELNKLYENKEQVFPMEDENEKEV